jgi:hypothetical protein
MVIMVMAVMVCPDFRIEWPCYVGDCRAEAPKHILKNVVGLNVESVLCQFSGGVPITEMPGDAGHGQRVLNFDLKKRLGRRAHFDQAFAAFEDISMMHEHGIGEVDKHIAPAIGCHANPPAVAAFAVEGDAV